MQADTPALGEMVAEAFLRYRAFARPGWQPPGAAVQVNALRRWLADPGFWGELVEDAYAIAGFATFLPATRHHSHPDPDTEMVHIGHLFVVPHEWGTGLARLLLARACAAAGERGFARVRLFVAAGQTRARRFYARERFIEAGEPFVTGVGIPMLECRRELV